MQPKDLNMTTTVTGHQLFLFVTFGDRRDDGELTEALDLLHDLAISRLGRGDRRT